MKEEERADCSKPEGLNRSPAFPKPRTDIKFPAANFSRPREFAV